MGIKKTPSVEKVEKDHQHLKRDMDQLTKEVSAKISEEQFPEWKLEFTWQLRDFKNQLLKHFELEEEGGFNEELIHAAPEHHNRVRQLEDEHKQIISTLEKIVADLKQMDPTSFHEAPAIRERVLNLLKLLRAHEAAERQLIQDAYLQDFGAAD